MVTTAPSSDVKVGPEVFINFRGVELRKTFVSNLHARLRRNGINAFMDSDEYPGRELKNFFKRIEVSKIALAVLSSRYTESQWCLNELVKMKECSMRDEGGNTNLLVIPILYKLKTSTVANLEGEFGLNLWNLWRLLGCQRDNRILKWTEALEDVLSRKALVLPETSKDEENFVASIVTHVKNALDRISQQSGQNPNPQAVEQRNPQPQRCLSRGSYNTEPEEQRLKKLEQKLDVECTHNETRVLGLVGMPGIGKSYLAKILYHKLKKKIGHCVFIEFEREKSKEQGSEWLRERLVEGLLDQDYLDWEDRLAKFKIVVVLDNVIDRGQTDLFFGNSDWIKKGSKIVITTRDKSKIEGLPACDLYEVPGLNEKEAFELFRAGTCSNIEGSFLEMSRKFVEFAGGNPLALKAFGEELKGKDEEHWKARVETLTQCSNEEVKKELGACFDGLKEKQKDAFLDIAYFFRSQGEEYVRTFFDSVDPESLQAGKEFRSLVDKFLINVSDGRVEMHDLLFTMAKELSGGKYWMFPSNFVGSFTHELKTKKEKGNVRGIILDMSKMEEEALHNNTFVDLRSLRYLKVYYSLCPRLCEATCILNLPDGIEFAQDNIVWYLDWMLFQGKELPSNFEPINLIDLRLPYSKITCIWSCFKGTPKLKWVDLSHSRELSSISSLSDAPNLLSLNLEGCTSLKELPEQIQKMKNLVYLNLRGCTSFLSLPNITMDSLKTLILSGCSKFEMFEVISKHLETLYLNGTAVSGLPPAFGTLHKLIFLNLKDCTNLVTLPDCLGDLKSLQELKLSRCFKFKIFPDVIVENLRILLLDSTSIIEMPSNISGSSFLRRLCLSRNDKICSLQLDMGQLIHLKWLELKYCKNLTSLPSLPPNLLCLNAHGCTSLRTVASPLAPLLPTEQIHSVFIFSSCHELEQVSKNNILSYIQKKSESMSEDRYNREFVFKSLLGTCFPGYEVPAWFNHQVCGSVLKLEFPRDGNGGRVFGIALCAVVNFKGYKGKTNSLQLKCMSEFTNLSLSPESFIVGGWSEQGDELHTVESDHVFIAYTPCFNLKKRQQFSSSTEVSLKFEVTNGASEVKECKVMKCGFSLVYEPEEAENTSWEVNTTIGNNRLVQTTSLTTTEDAPVVTPTTADYNKMNGILNFFSRRAQ